MNGFALIFEQYQVHFWLSNLILQHCGSWTDTNGVVDTATTMNVTWSTTETGDSIVKYGRSLPYSSQATGTTAYSASLGMYVHTVKLTGLLPNQIYYYSVGSTGLGESADFTFRTAPTKGTAGSYTIGVWSDTQNNAGNTNFEVTSGIVAKMISYAPLFTLHTGDMVENGSRAPSVNNFLKSSQDLNASAPLMPVLGNHDLTNVTGGSFQAPYGEFLDGFNLPAMSSTIPPITAMPTLPPWIPGWQKPRRHWVNYSSRLARRNTTGW